jgi:hypothetical protein
VPPEIYSYQRGYLTLFPLGEDRIRAAPYRRANAKKNKNLILQKECKRANMINIEKK